MLKSSKGMNTFMRGVPCPTPKPRDLRASGPLLPEYVKASIDQWDLVEGDIGSLSWETEQLQYEDSCRECRYSLVDLRTLLHQYKG